MMCRPPTWLQSRVQATDRAAIIANFLTGPREENMARILVTDRDGHEHEVEGQLGLKVMETLRELDYGVTAICGGLCSCATCHVFVAPEWRDRVPAPQSDEKELLVELSHFEPDSSRLSCQIEFTAALDGLRVKIAPDE
jgi:2Fe-2S ferredoxin